jgi:hypothetical protein
MKHFGKRQLFRARIEQPCVFLRGALDRNAKPGRRAPQCRSSLGKTRASRVWNWKRQSSKKARNEIPDPRARLWYAAVV